MLVLSKPENTIFTSRVGSRGRIDFEHLEDFLTTNVRNALWDFVLEAYVLPLDLTVSSESGEELSPAYSTLLLQWLNACPPTSPSINKSAVNFAAHSGSNFEFGAPLEMFCLVRHPPFLNTDRNFSISRCFALNGSTTTPHCSFLLATLSSSARCPGGWQKKRKSQTPPAPPDPP